MPSVEMGELLRSLDIVGSVLVSPDESGLILSPTLMTVRAYNISELNKTKHD